MSRAILVLLLSIAVVSCGQSPAPDETAGFADATADAPPMAAVTSNPCSLIDDPETLFGRPVTAGVKTLPNKTMACEWISAEGRLCGIVTPFGPGWNEIRNLKANYSAMAGSVGTFGPPQPLTGAGEEAVIVDGGILGAQVAMRTSNAIASIGAACGGSGAANLEHAEKIARAIAGHL